SSVARALGGCRAPGPAHRQESTTRAGGGLWRTVRAGQTRRGRPDDSAFRMRPPPSRSRVSVAARGGPAAGHAACRGRNAWRPRPEAERRSTVEARVAGVPPPPEIMRDHKPPGAPGRWPPLIYIFRHYFGLGPELGRSFRATTPSAETRTVAISRR